MEKRHRVRRTDTGEEFIMVEQVQPSPAISGPRRDISTYYLDDDSGEFLRQEGPGSFVGTMSGLIFERVGGDGF